MSVFAMNWASGAPTGDPLAKLLLLVLANQADAEGSVPRALARGAAVRGVTQMSAAEHELALDKLTRLGLVTVDGRWLRLNLDLPL